MDRPASVTSQYYLLISMLVTNFNQILPYGQCMHLVHDNGSWQWFMTMHEPCIWFCQSEPCHVFWCPMRRVAVGMSGCRSGRTPVLEKHRHVKAQDYMMRYVFIIIYCPWARIISQPSINLDTSWRPNVILYRADGDLHIKEIIVSLPAWWIL